MPRLKRSIGDRERIGIVESDFLEALARGLRVIETFDHDRMQLTLSDIAKIVDLPRASVRRTLHTLVQLGYAELNGRLFRLTPRILVLARAYLQSNAVTGVLQPALEQLSEEVNESCSAAVLDGEDIMMIAHASPKRIIPVSAQIGFRVPAIASALGRVLLAALPDKELDEFLARHDPRQLTRSTLLDKRALRKTILKIREDGYALVDQEVEIGFRSVAVPLRKLDGKTIASLNIGAHSARTPLRVTHNTHLPKLRALADRLKQQLI